MNVIDKEAIPATIASKAADFVCSPAMKAAPLGGMNEWSADTTAILNLPIGPDGHRMVALWVDPHLVPMYRSYGVAPITRGDWKELKLEGTSPTIDLNSEDGLVYRDSRAVCAAWTTKTRKTELDAAMTEAANRCMGARANEAARQARAMDAYGLQNGVAHFTEDSYAQDGEIPFDEDMIAMPGRGAPRVSLAGPKMAGTTVWDDGAGG
ncbi:MAG TPA: hypothetical protein VNA25_19515 [Phycisphaerae bacterium]|nr:hypothetical protein [Phycisphaerae bacterium]